MLITKVTGLGEARQTKRTPDELIVEEPMSIQLDGTLIATTMRTPGNDYELAAGFAIPKDCSVAPRSSAFVTASTGMLSTASSTSSGSRPVVVPPSRLHASATCRPVADGAEVNNSTTSVPGSRQFHRAKRSIST